METTKVLVVGSWHLGSVVGCCLAESGNQVELWDQQERVSASWSLGKPPIFEPGLNEIVAKQWGKRLFWCSEHDFKQKAACANWIVVAYDTPVTEQDELVLDVVEEGFDKILASGFSDNTNFFLTSQLPVGTSNRFLKRVQVARPNWRGTMYYMPENLRLGAAIESFRRPDRIVLGISGDKIESGLQKFRTLCADQTTPIKTMSLASAEMVKHALNTFLAMCVVYANEVATICENHSADAWDVMNSLKLDSRVGPKAFLRPGLGFSGGTLARDVKILSHLAEKPAAHNLFSQIYTVNSKRVEWVLDRLKAEVGTLAGSRIVLLGVTYKPGTSTVRRSPAIEIGAALKAAGANCVALDPMADLNELTAEERARLPFQLVTSAEAAFKKADGAIVVTEWKQFLELPLKSLCQSMNHAVIIDTKNLFPSESAANGIKLVVPGRAW